MDMFHIFFMVSFSVALCFKSVFDWTLHGQVDGWEQVLAKQSTAGDPSAGDLGKPSLKYRNRSQKFKSFNMFQFISTYFDDLLLMALKSWASFAMLLPCCTMVLATLGRFRTWSYAMSASVTCTARRNVQHRLWSKNLRFGAVARHCLHFVRLRFSLHRIRQNHETQWKMKRKVPRCPQQSDI